MKRKNEEGSILVIVCAGMVVIIGMLGLVIDVANVHLNQARLVNAVDAAVLAGVQELPELPTLASLTANDYGGANQLQSGELSVTISHNNSRIAAVAKRQVELHFMQLFGISHSAVEAYAMAEVGMVAGYSGVAPFGIVWDDYQFGQLAYLKIDPDTGNNQQGNFGALALGGNGANNFRNNIKYGYDGYLKVGDKIPTEPGNMAGPTYDGLIYRLRQDPHGHILDGNTNSARYIIVPIIDSFDVKGRDLVTVLGFAAFFLEDTSTQGKQAFVEGRFVKMAVDGVIGNGGDYGLKAFQLIK